MTIEKTPGLLEKLEQLYVADQPAVVAAYLEQNPSLWPLLQEAHASFRQFFPDGPLVLESHPPTDENDAPLVIAVHPTADLDDALIQYNQLKLKWWVRAYERFEPWLSIAFRHPGLDTSESFHDFLERIAGSYDGPADWSAEHDHYLYGTPKRWESLPNE